MSDPSRHVTPLDKELWLLDEADQTQRERVESTLDPDERARLRREHETLTAELCTRVPVERVRRRFEARTRPAAKGAAPRLWLAAAAAALVVGLAVLGHPPSLDLTTHATEAPTPNSGERSKGLSPGLHVYRKRGSSAERVVPPVRLRPHEVLQLGYVAAGRSHGVLLSVDGASAVTLHFPSDSAADTSLRQGEQLLSSAYELDDAPGFERFFWVVSAHAISVTDVIRAAERLARQPQQARRGQLALPADLEQVSLSFDKERL